MKLCELPFPPHHNLLLQIPNFLPVATIAVTPIRQIQVCMNLIVCVGNPGRQHIDYLGVYYVFVELGLFFNSDF